MSIQIATHVYAKALPQFSIFLRAQLTSLLKSQFDDFTGITVFYTHDDQRVVDVLDYFDPLFDGLLVRRPMSEPYLFRRSIGRNMAALNCSADLLWCTDVDHVFGPHCLKDLQTQWDALEEKPSLIYASDVQIQAAHSQGDQFVSKHLTTRGLLGIEDLEFVQKKYLQPVGGVHILNGDFARRHGYLRDISKWQRPEIDQKPFRCFRDDRAFVKYCRTNGSTKRIQVPGIFRLRHTETTYKPE